MRLQYQLSNGKWIDCDDRTDEFLRRCETNNGPDETGKIVPRFLATRDLTRDEVIQYLAAGAELRNHPADWYSECRDGEAVERRARRQKPVNCGPKKTGQLWEECPRCGREPIYMPLHLCDRCWPKGPPVSPEDVDF